jgi:hypothetical protein
MANKANIERQPVDRYIISGNQIVSYLQDQLGFPVCADFTRWTGVTANHSCVRMRVAIANKDIVAAQPAATTYADRVLQENAAGFNFKSDVTDVLDKFMYPVDFSRILSDQSKVQQMYVYGMYGDRLQEVIKFSKLAFVQEQKMWRVYLRPEAIIKDMLADPTTGEIDGSFAITGVFGTSTDTVRWEIEINKGGMANTEMGVVSIDKLFAN